MTSGFDHCAALVREADRDRYLAALFAPEAARAALFALYAFNVEIARVREVAREPMPGEIRLQWWREVLAGERDGEAAGHPVASALRAAMARHAIAPEPLAGLVEAHAFDLYGDPMATLDEMDAYAMATEGALFATAARILGHDADALARHAGLACGITAVLNDFGRHAARGQLFVPLEVLTRHGVDPNDIFAGVASPGLPDALAEMRRHALRHLDAARAGISALPAQVLPAFLPVALAGPLLQRMTRAGHDPFQPAALSNLRRQWLLWRAARNPARAFG
jgi:phytoene synthase